MITKISKLKGFGVFHDFCWNGIDDFLKRNLIYGWNYSGKTTLSKIFQVLEFKDKSRYFPGNEFEVHYNENGQEKLVSQNNLVDFAYSVKVFNCEYIRRVFTWEEPDIGFKPISFYLGDPAGELKKKIDKLELINGRFINLKENKYKKIVNEFEEYEKTSGKFSDKAKDIRDNYLPDLFDQNSLNKSHIKSIADSIKSELSKYLLLPEERDSTKKQATASKSFDPINEDIRLSELLEELKIKVKNVLEDSAPKTVPFPDLDDNTDLFNWVQKGISFHEEEDVCRFCGQQLPDKLIENLNTYYSKKLTEIQGSIEEIKRQIYNEKEKIKTTFPNTKEIFDSYRDSYSNAIDSFEETKIKYDRQLDILLTDLDSKAGNLFTSISASQITKVSFKNDFDLIEESIKKHNEWLRDFDKRKSDSTRKILEHYIAEYLETEDYLHKEIEKECANKSILKIEGRIDENNKQILSYRSQLSDKVKGQDELNLSLRILLHRDDIRIEIRNDKFTLERSGNPATDLSEGEKSAIAFSYFLTELKSLRDDNPSKLPRTIIFIDDPISSLDSNHIFQVRSILKDFFKTDDFAQLFISTHNFEFFSVMYDSKIFSQKQREDQRPLYFIRRDNDGYSTIEKMPKTFSNYKSEYVGLFNILKEFNESDDQDNFPYLLMIPNTLRRFVELYTLSKYPGSNFNTVDQRVEIVFKSDEMPHHCIKLLNWFSHQNQFEKLQSHDDKLLQIKDAISDLLIYLENKDNLHWRGLTGTEPA